MKHRGHEALKYTFICTELSISASLPWCFIISLHFNIRFQPKKITYTYSDNKIS